ncbi:hypothetical protein Tco_0355307 [Tanacetum coccineum]
MIGNSGDKMPMLAIVDNVHGMAHASSIDNIDHLRIHGSMLLIYCAYAFFTGLRILAGQPHLDCGCSHAICVPFNFVESGRTTECKNWSPQQPLQAHTGHGLTQGRFITSLLKCHIDTWKKDDYRKPFMEFMVNLFLPFALPFHKKRCCPPELNVGKANKP